MKGVQVYFPIHDVGVDLLVTKGQKHAGIQVKESRYYVSRIWPSGHKGHSWHQIKKGKLLKDDVDLYIFLTYVPSIAEHKVSSFDNRFVIVPRTELLNRISLKDPGSSNIYSFCFHFGDTFINVWDERVTVVPHNELTDYSKFLDAWDTIQQMLE